ncbi:hypothetical protein DY000_02053764 [Brassica cretica]|uniref:Uncharacterized protein n=1 Tax=Brassica cretica TaxID=69181 RepID=A0ABQ7AA19_BRACR|nr:hypothetical protein DY000_02053764 [Brassica cretica]
MGRTACTDERTDGLSDYFDLIFEFNHQEFSKATILKLSDDLSHIWSSSVCEKLHSDRADCPAHVLVLNAGRAAGYIEYGKKYAKRPSTSLLVFPCLTRSVQVYVLYALFLHISHQFSLTKNSIKLVFDCLVWLAPNNSLLLVGPVRHIRQQIENHLFVGHVSHIRRQSDTGTSKATPHPSCDPMIHQYSHRSSYQNRTGRVFRTSGVIVWYQSHSTGII